MKFTSENNELTIFLSGVLGSSTAVAVYQEIQAILSANPHETLILNAAELEEITSAGLRILLKIRKDTKNFKITEVSSAVYEIFQMTGFTEMMTIEKGFRRISIEGCAILGNGAKGTVYRYQPDTIVKVYKNPDCLPEIRRERQLARRAFILGIPTAISYDIVRVGECYGTVFELLDAKTYSRLIQENPDQFDTYMHEIASLLKKIHSIEISEGEVPDIKQYALNWVKSASKYLDKSEQNCVNTIIQKISDPMTMLHCDFHTNNIMLQNGEALLIDMESLCHGHPIFEFANMYIAFVGFGETNPLLVEDFLGLPYETAKRIWRSILPIYFETDDRQQLTELEETAKMLAYLRLIHHASTRLTVSPQKYQTMLDHSLMSLRGVLLSFDKI